MEAEETRQRRAPVCACRRGLGRGADDVADRYGASDGPELQGVGVRYADDKEVFYADFAKAFTKLMELGIQRDAQEKVANLDNLKGRYHSAPKKANKPGLPNASNEEAKPLRMENEKFRARL